MDRSLNEVDLNLYEVDRSLYEVHRNFYKVVRSLYEVDILFYNQHQLEYFFLFLPMTISINYLMFYIVFFHIFRYGEGKVI